jgi:hypothetical protein
LSIRATRSPAWPRRIAVVQPERLAPTTATSNRGSVEVMAEILLPGGRRRIVQGTTSFPACDREERE